MHAHTHAHIQSSCTVTSLMEMKEQEGKTWNVCGWSYKRTEELWGRTSKTGTKKITCEPHASFLLVAAFFHTLHDGYFFLQGAFLTVPCCFTWGVSLSLTHPVLVYAESTSCAPQCWFIWGVTLTYPVLVYLWSFSYTPHAGFFFLGVSLIRSMLASLCREFLLYKTKIKHIKVNKNVHNWVMLQRQTSNTGSTRLHHVFQQTVLK